MTCRACGAELEPGARFCGVCGDRVAVPGGPGYPGAGAPAAGRREPADPMIGQVLNNRFKVEAKLGEGGFGAVYRGTQSGVGRAVAIKVLHPEMTRDRNLVARFRREGEVMCQLRDAHTVTTYDFDETQGGVLFIAMELLEGTSLHDLFHRDGPLAWRRMIKVVTEMCSSLAEAHELGIVHRDLKPENIVLESRPGNAEFVKILDFGIAKVMRGDGSGGGAVPQLTATGQTLGTLEYMSPEQLMGKALDGRSDVYALGVLSYEMITGQLPFPDAVGPAALIGAQLKSTPPPPSTVRPDGRIPRDVDALIMRMLAKERGDRQRDVSAVRDECERILAGHASAPVAVPQEPTSAPAEDEDVQATPLTPGFAQVDASRPHAAPVSGGGTSRGARLWPWIALSVVLAAAAIASALLLQ